MTKLVLCVLVAVLALGVPRHARADVYIQAACQVTAAQSACTFTNTGSSQGTACATVHVTNRSSGAATHSTIVCSGDVESQSSKSVPVIFVETQPAALCPAMTDCAVTVSMDNVAVSGVAALVPLLVPLVVLLSSIWVFVDAKRIGARKGLLKGLADLSSGGWLVSSLLLWIVAFPLYLASRGKIKAAVAATGAALPA
jgi:hypothetical protein